MNLAFGLPQHPSHPVRHHPDESSIFPQTRHHSFILRVPRRCLPERLVTQMRVSRIYLQHPVVLRPSQHVSFVVVHQPLIAPRVRVHVHLHLFPHSQRDRRIQLQRHQLVVARSMFLVVRRFAPRLGVHQIRHVRVVRAVMPVPLAHVHRRQRVVESLQVHVFRVHSHPAEVSAHGYRADFDRIDGQRGGASEREKHPGKAVILAIGRGGGEFGVVQVIARARELADGHGGRRRARRCAARREGGAKANRNASESQ